MDLHSFRLLLVLSKYISLSYFSLGEVIIGVFEVINDWYLLLLILLLDALLFLLSPVEMSIYIYIYIYTIINNCWEFGHIKLNSFRHKWRESFG